MKEFVQMLSPDKLLPFEKHPFQVREDESLEELMESIRCYGVLSPLLARPKGERYELVSGHRRRLAARKLGMEVIPVLVREMSDDEAVILMVDSNLQREHLLPPEPDHTEEELLETIIRQMAKAQGVDEDLKAHDPLAWVGAMNNIKSATQEFFRGKT